MFPFNLTCGDVFVATPSTPTLPTSSFTCRGVSRLLRLLELTVEVLRQYGIVPCGEVRPQDGTAQRDGEYRLLRQKKMIIFYVNMTVMYIFVEIPIDTTYAILNLNSLRVLVL